MLKTIEKEILIMDIFIQNKKKMLINGKASDKVLNIIDPVFLNLKTNKERHYERPVIFKKKNLIIKLSYE